MDSADTALRDFLWLAIIFMLAAYFVGFSTTIATVVNAVDVVARFVTGQKVQQVKK